MKIKRLHLRNFHGFKNEELSFSEKFTVLIGDNGTGKTAILDGIAVALGGFLTGIADVSSRNILPSEVRLCRFLQGNSLTIEPQYPVEVSCVATIQNKEYSWDRALNSKKGKTTRKNAVDIINYAMDLQRKVSSGEKVVLPVFAYHGTGRLWAQTSDTLDELYESGSRMLGYRNCLNPISNEKLFTKWFKKMKFIALEEGKEPGEYTAVRRAIESCICGMEEDGKESKISIDYKIKEDEIRVAFGDSKILPFRMLSDGYRNAIGMVADIAFRAAVLNPHLEESAALETPGIVLIDELDLHLHPKWQQRIVEDLKRTFPKIQFITTTHSPFIIQSLDVGELRVLDPVGIDGGLGEYENMSIEDVTENLMGVTMPQWGKRRRDMYKAAQEYFSALNKMEGLNLDPEEIESLKKKLDELSKPFASNVAYVAFLEQKRTSVENRIKEVCDETGTER